MTEQTTKQPNLDKKALMALMLKKKGIVAPKQTVISPSANGGPLPLSYAQERIWSLYKLDPESPAYHMPVARSITGQLDKQALTQSLETIASRHHILRSAFPEHDGQPKQLLMPNFVFPLTNLDLSEQTAESQTAAVKEAMNNFGEKPFDIEGGPLVRALLIEQSPEQHIILLVFHQIIFDGSSAGIFMHELTTLYDALAVGQTADLPPLTIQYADYTLWYRDTFTPEKVAAQRNYWQRHLSQPYQPLSLPLDHPRPARESFAGRAVNFTLPSGLGQKLKTFSQQQGTTLFATLLAGFNTLLHLYSQQEDIIIFTSAEGRVQPQLKPLIGLFGRQLPLRTDLSKRPTFKTLLSRVSQVIKDAFANQDVAFAELVETIRLEDGYSPSALFQAMFIFLSEPRPALALSGLQLEPLPPEKQVAKFDWRLLMVDQEDLLSGRLEYKSELFDEATIAQIPDHLEQLLTAVTENPDQHLDTLLSLPAGQFGRLDAKQQNQAPTKHAYVAPRDRAELEMKQIWEETLGLSAIGIHDDFFELGGHSLSAVRLMALIEERTGRKLPLTTLFKASTIEQLVNLIGDENWEKYKSSLIPIRKDGRLTPFFFVPPAGTTVLKYASFIDLMDDEQPFYGLQPVGLEDGETPQTTVEQMAAYYLQDVQTLQPNGPYLLGGQCFGGLVAFEMARQLKKQGQEVSLVAIIDTELPPRKPIQSNGYHNGASTESAVSKLIRFPWNSYVFFRKTYKRTLATRMWAHKNPLYLLQNVAIWQRYSHTLKAHLEARLSYVVPETYPGHVSLLQFSASHHEQKDGRWLWEQLAEAGIDIQEIPSDQTSRANGEFSKKLGKWLKSHLAQAHQNILQKSD